MEQGRKHHNPFELRYGSEEQMDVVNSDGNILSTNENYTHDENRANIHGATDSVVLRNIEMHAGEENLRDSVINDVRSSVDGPFR